MKSSHHISARTIVFVCFAACAVPASADTTTLTITGKVLAGTCHLDIPPVTLADLPAAEVKAGDLGMQDGKLDFKTCVAVKKVNLEFTGTAEDGDADHWKNTAAVGAARGIAVVLKDGVANDTLLKSGDKRSYNVSGNNASYPFKVGYHHADGAGFTAGAVAASITVNAAYE